MKLYTYDPAPNPRRLAMFLRYKGLQLDTEQVDLMQGEQFSEAFSQINPQKTLIQPTIAHSLPAACTR